MTLIFGIFHILEPQKEKVFCPCVVFILGILASVLVLLRIREMEALFLFKRLNRYCGAIFFTDLQVITLIYVKISCCSVFHPNFSKIGLI